MPTQADIDQQRQLLDTHRARLAHYLIQRAQLGAEYIPPGVSSGIAGARAEIRRIKGILRSWGRWVEDLPDDEEYISAPPSTFGHLHSRNTRSNTTPPLLNVYPNLRDSYDPVNRSDDPLPPMSPLNGADASLGKDDGFIGFIVVVVIIGIVVAALSNSSNSSKECTDTICFGQTKQGEITSTGEQAAYTFTAKMGDRIIAIASRALDDPRQGTLEPRITIEPKPPAELESSCSASDPLVARVRCTLTSTGVYTITIADRQDENVGTYRLFLQRLNNPGQATNLPFDRSSTGEITATGILTVTAQRVTYTFTTTDTARLSIFVNRTSGDLEPQIQVFQPDGNPLLDCDADDVENIEISCKPTVSGTYTILIFARNNGPTKGAYILRIARLKQPHSGNVIRFSRSGSIPVRTRFRQRGLAHPEGMLRV